MVLLWLLEFDNVLPRLFNSIIKHLTFEDYCQHIHGIHCEQFGPLFGQWSLEGGLENFSTKLQWIRSGFKARDVGEMFISDIFSHEIF